MSKISVLVPAYNTGAYIDKCIESILKQSYTNLEIIIVDDGSDDNTVEVANRYAEFDSRIKIFSTIHRGVAEARNECLRNATGDYVLFVDSDDWIESELCKVLYSTIKKHSADIVFSPMKIIAKNESTKEYGNRKCIFGDIETLSGIECFVKMVNTGCTYPMVSGNLYRRRLIDENGLCFKGVFHEDEFFSPCSLKVAKVVCYIQNTFYYYRKRHYSIMNNDEYLYGRAFSLCYIANELIKHFESREEIESDDFNFVLRTHVSTLKRRAFGLLRKYLTDKRSDILLIFTEHCIGSKYGIGTYLSQVAKTQVSQPRVTLQIELSCSDISQISITITNGLLCIRIPSIINFKNIASTDLNKYEVAIYYLINSIIHDKSKIVCHFNTFGHHILANLFRKNRCAMVVFTLHYTNWSFKVLGNRHSLLSIINGNTKRTTESMQILSSFQLEKDFLNNCCDRIIAIAKHSHDMLIELYKIDQSKISLIYNSMETLQCTQQASSKKLRHKYGFSEDDIILIFAGRIDKVKGIYNLVQTLQYIYPSIPNIRLIIVGDGAYNLVLRDTNPLWGRIHFTGFVDKVILSEMYALSDLGIIPSFHEEFGYVAMEMITVGLPILVNATGGLYEISKCNTDISYRIECSLCDVQGFAKEIISTLSKLSLKKRIPHLKISEHLCFERFCKDLNSLYDELFENID